MNEQNPRQLQGVADLLATRGRYGDSMMVHMNPIEVQGLASMSPTGSLTVNPDTGQPEAFLPFLLPLLGGLGGSALAGTAALGGTALAGNAALLGAIGSGLGSFAATGDLKQGLVSGITGFGIGSALGGLGGAASDAATEGTKQAAIDAALEASKQAATQIVPSTTMTTAQQAGLQEAMKGSLSTFPSSGGPLINPGGAFGGGPPIGGVKAAIPTVGENLGRAFSKEGLAALTSTPTLLAVGIGEGTNMQIREDELMNDLYGVDEEAKEAEYAKALGQMNANMYDPNLPPAPYEPTNYSDNYNDYANYGDNPRRYNQGGIVSIDPDDFQRRYKEMLEMGLPIKEMYVGGSLGNLGLNLGYGTGLESKGALPAQRQASLRGAEVISGDELNAIYDKQGSPGFGGEISYFRDPLPEIAPTADGASGAATGDSPINLSGVDLSGINWMRGGISPVMSAIIARRTKGEISTEEMQKQIAEISTTVPEGSSDYVSRYGNIGLSGLGLAEGKEVPSKSGNQLAPKDLKEENAFIERLIYLVQAAILGDLSPDEAEAVINMFIDEFGPEVFMDVRNAVLEQVVPNSQKEGEISGVGGGMDDLIGGMIGNQQPVAVSPGEYIVPADVVSGLGDGSTDSGVTELDRMLDRVRVERTNTTKQPAPLGRGGVLPA